MMGMGQFDPEQIKAMHNITKNIKGKIVINNKTNTLSIRLTPTTPEAQKFVGKMLPMFTKQMVDTLSSAFGIMGDLTEIE